MSEEDNETLKEYGKRYCNTRNMVMKKLFLLYIV